MIGPGLGQKRCWGDAHSSGAVRVEAIYRCEWCGKEERLIVFGGEEARGGPPGWISVFLPQIGRELFGVFCSSDCQEVEVLTWRQALENVLASGADPDPIAWTKGLAEEFARLKSDRPF